MKKILTLSIMTFFLLLNGCAKVPTTSMIDDAKAKEFNPPPTGKAGVYVYRSSALSTAIKKDIYIDKKCLGESAIHTFFYTTVDGNQTHMVSTESEFSPNDVTLYMEAGKNYYVEQYTRLGLFVAGASVEVEKEKEAQRKIKPLKLGISGHCDTTY